MRRSVYDGEEWEFSVTLNGETLIDVIWADEETGEAQVYEHEWALERRGQRVEDPSEPLGFRTQTVRGQIQIIRINVPPAAQQEIDWGEFYECGPGYP